MTTCPSNGYRAELQVEGGGGGGREVWYGRGPATAAPRHSTSQPAGQDSITHRTDTIPHFPSHRELFPPKVEKKSLTGFSRYFL